MAIRWQLADPRRMCSAASELRGADLRGAEHPGGIPNRLARLGAQLRQPPAPLHRESQRLPVSRCRFGKHSPSLCACVTRVTTRFVRAGGDEDCGGGSCLVRAHGYGHTDRAVPLQRLCGGKARDHPRHRDAMPNRRRTAAAGGGGGEGGAGGAGGPYGVVQESREHDALRCH